MSLYYKKPDVTVLNIHTLFMGGVYDQEG